MARTAVLFVHMRRRLWGTNLFLLQVCLVYILEACILEVMSISELLPLSFAASRKNSFSGAAELCLFNVIYPACDGDFCHLSWMK
jgi:hypothetical protein